MSALGRAEESSLRANAFCCLPNDRQVQPRSRHSGEAGPAARPTCPDWGWPPGTLGNGHATRMSPDRGNCRGSGLNDVHRGVGGTVVTVSSPYAQFMAHNASLSIPARSEFAGSPFARVAANSKLIIF